MKVHTRPYSQPLHLPMNNCAGQIAMTALLAGTIFTLFPVTLLQATAIGCGVLAVRIAIAEHRHLSITQKIPFPTPSFRFSLANFDQVVEPWHETLQFCKLALNIGGGVFLLTQFAASPYVALTWVAFGAAARLIKKPPLQNECIAIGVAGLALRFLNFNPCNIVMLSTVAGYFACDFILSWKR